MHKHIIILLILALVVPQTGWALTVDDSGQTGAVSTSSDDEEDSYGKEIAFGVFAAVIVILVWIGFRSDRNWMQSRDDAPPVTRTAEKKPSWFFDIGRFGGDAAAATLNAEPSAELAAQVGMELRF